MTHTPEAERERTLDLEAIRKRVDDATPGPWIADVDSDRTQIGPQDGVNDPYDGGLPYTRRPIVENAVKRGGRLEDFHFIAHAREDVPLLIAEVERLTALLHERQQEGWRPEDVYAAMLKVEEGWGMGGLAGRNRGDSIYADFVYEVLDRLRVPPPPESEGESHGS